MIRALRNVAIFLLALVLGCHAIGLCLPLPTIDEVSAKLEHLRRHPGDYDTLFFGTSRVYRQIIPAEFDALTAAAGVPTKSFNAGVDGMRPPELDFYIEQVLRCHLRGVRRVFVETVPLSSDIAPDRRDTLRGTYWHDWPRLWLVMRVAWEECKMPRKAGRKERLARAMEEAGSIADHLQPFFRHETNLGRASLFTDSLMEPPSPLSMWALGEHGDGFKTADRTEMNPAERADYERSLERRRDHQIQISYGTPTAQESFAKLLRGLDGLGATTVLFLAPTNSFHKFHLSPEIERQHLLLDYSDVDKYPELYEAKYRLDTDHLNLPGAEILTRLVAQEYCASLSASPGSKRGEAEASPQK